MSELSKKIISALLNLSWASVFLTFILSDGFCAFAGIAGGAQPLASQCSLRYPGYFLAVQF